MVPRPPAQLHPRRLAEVAGGVALRVAPDDLAGRVSQLVRRMPPERLDQIMRTPARRAVLDAIFSQMPGRLDRRRAGGVNTSVRWEITGRGDGKPDVYDLVIADGRARSVRGGTGVPPRLTITVDAAEFLRIATGGSSPMGAYFNGKLALRGDVMQAARIVMLFRIPGAESGRSAARPR